MTRKKARPDYGPPPSVRAYTDAVKAALRNGESVPSFPVPRFTYPATPKPPTQPIAELAGVKKALGSEAEKHARQRESE
jgi:hypothetical protein